MASVLIAITGIYCLEIDPSSTVTAHTNNSPAFLSTIPLTYLPEDGLGTNLTPPGTNMSLECLNCNQEPAKLEFLRSVWYADIYSFVSPNPDTSALDACPLFLTTGVFV